MISWCKIDQYPCAGPAEFEVVVLEMLETPQDHVNIQDTKLTAELSSISELNKYLGQGWILILSYVANKNDTHQPRFVVAWQNDGPPVYPEVLDEWEQREMRRQYL